MEPNLEQSKDFTAELGSNSAVELAAPAVLEILNFITSAIPVLGNVGNAAYNTWQAQQQRRFAIAVRHLFETINDKKLDKDYIGSTEHRELILKIVEAATIAGSERKQFALAGALVNSCIFPGSKVPGKLSLLSNLTLMSDDEQDVLEVIQNGQTPAGVYEEAIADQLKLELELIQGVCEELEYHSLISRSAITSAWLVTSRGKRLIEWYTGLEQVGNQEIFRTNVRQEVWEVLAERSRAEVRGRGL